MTGLADAGKTGVPQVSPDAIGTVSPISQSAGRRNCAASAGLETRDTADLEVCATGLPMKYPGLVCYSPCVAGIGPKLRPGTLFRRQGSIRGLYGVKEKIA